MARHARRSTAAALLTALPAATLAQSPALTIYNQGFAVARQNIELDLKVGINDITFSDTTVHLEPESVILRDTRRSTDLRILEQNFRSDPISPGLLLALHEGKTIDFRVGHGEYQKLVRGRIVRAAYVPHTAAFRRYGEQYQWRQMSMAHGDHGGGGQPIVEVDGEIRFGLPGEPVFRSLGDETILKPTLNWLIRADAPGRINAELGYVTGGLM